MKHVFRQLWNDDGGALIASEFLFLSSLLVLGTIIGLTNVRSAVNVELSEFANALLATSQGFIIFGQVGCSAQVDGSQAIDTPSLVVPVTNLPPAIPSAIDILPCQ